jgi:hypothetical protein
MEAATEHKDPVKKERIEEEELKNEDLEKVIKSKPYEQLLFENDNLEF